MSAEWSKVQLKDLISIKHGFAFKGGFFKDEPPGDILLTPGNFAIGGGFKSDKLKYYDGPVPEDYVLREGDLVITMTDLSRGSDTLGLPAILPHTEGSRLLHNQRLGKVEVLTDAPVIREFLYYRLCAADYRHEVVAGATGTTVKHTSPSRILAFRFSIPPLPEQQGIAHILGTLDDKIELNRRMSETLEGIARALFKAWFVDFDPVRAKAEGRQPVGMDAETAALFPDSFQKSELGLIPAGWEVRGLSEIATFLNGLALQKYPPEGEESLPVIKIAQLRAGNTTGADLAGLNIPNQYVVHDGDMLFSWSGSLEVEIWCGGTGALNQHLFKVTSDAFPKWFYFHATREHLPFFREVARGKATTMGHIQRHHLKEALVACPPYKLISVIDQQIGCLIDRQVEASLESRTLMSLRDNLLPKLISGELRVPDAEKILEGQTFRPEGS